MVRNRKIFAEVFCPFGEFDHTKLVFALFHLFDGVLELARNTKGTVSEVDVVANEVSYLSVPMSYLYVGSNNSFASE